MVQNKWGRSVRIVKNGPFCVKSNCVVAAIGPTLTEALPAANLHLLLCPVGGRWHWWMSSFANFYLIFVHKRLIFSLDSVRLESRRSAAATAFISGRRWRCG